MKLSLLSFLCVATIAPSQPLLTSEHSDWLIDPSPYKAEVTVDQERNEIVMHNGLIRRAWRLSPNAATVALDNLMTGESMLRGVKPEAMVRIRGMDLAVGGLIGQPNYAYLLPEWVDGLRSDPMAFQFDSYDMGQTQAPFEWKRVRRASDLPWPAPGVSLTLHFKASDQMAERLALAQIRHSELGRELILADDFEHISDEWQVHVSPHEHTTFSQEGNPGAMVAPANAAVFAQRDLPAGVRVVQCTVNAGTDRSNSWGPGITLLWPDRRVKFYIRPEQQRFGVFDGGREHLLEGLDTSVTHHLRLRLEGDSIACDASPDGNHWHMVHRIQLNETLGDPVAVRLGKTSLSGGSQDYASTGQIGRSVVGAFRAFGDLTEPARALYEEGVAFVNDLTVSIHYEMYDGIPLMATWMTLHNASDQTFRLESFTNEILAVVEYESVVDQRERWEYPNIHVESDYSFRGMDPQTANRTVNWVIDPQYETQVNHDRLQPTMLEVKPPIGPDMAIEPDELFTTFRTFILVHDSTERTRKGLALRRMYRTLAPWVTENPLMMHVRSADPNDVRLAIDQSAEVGFEMVIMTFWSGFNIENESPEYLKQIKELVDYANERGIELGGYSLLASRSVGPSHDVVSPPGTRPTFGQSPCLGSEWGKDYFRKLYQFFEVTGFNLLEHDGSYPGDVCASTEHPGHCGLNDSQWQQWRTISDFYKWCRAEGVFLNVPDWYFLVGSNKVGMGYREVNWSLPRAQQVIHTRQNIYDGTWQKTPSMGWMFVPLTEYHGGGAAATIEPLDQHRDHYERMLLSNLGAGVQACYRGPRLYDTDRTRELVKQTVDWFNRYRDILESDIIHSSSRRADGRDIDWIFHANPNLKHKGMLVVYNPLSQAVSRTISLNLYYTGLSEKAVVREQGGKPHTYSLDRHYTIRVPVNVEAEGFTWFLIESADGNDTD